MVKAEIRPPSSSSPEPAASAIKHDATERAAEPPLPITDPFPRAGLCPAGISIPGTPWTTPRPSGIPFVPSATCVTSSLALGTRLCCPGALQDTQKSLQWFWVGLEASLVKEIWFCSKVGKCFHWKMSKPETFTFFWGFIGFFHSALDPLAKLA